MASSGDLAIANQFQRQTYNSSNPESSQLDLAVAEVPNCEVQDLQARRYSPRIEADLVPLSRPIRLLKLEVIYGPSWLRFREIGNETLVRGLRGSLLDLNLCFTGVDLIDDILVFLAQLERLELGDATVGNRDARRLCEDHR